MLSPSLQIIHSRVYAQMSVCQLSGKKKIWLQGCAGSSQLLALQHERPSRPSSLQALTLAGLAAAAAVSWAEGGDDLASTPKATGTDRP